jgi:hypothetical protein
MWNVQTLVSLDLYIAYIRAVYHTCYYCSVTTDHIEELQRKCIQHLRRPLSKSLLDEIKAEKAKKNQEATEDVVMEEKDKEVIKKESPSKDNRDWPKRNGNV